MFERIRYFYGRHKTKKMISDNFDINKELCVITKEDVSNIAKYNLFQFFYQKENEFVFDVEDRM